MSSPLTFNDHVRAIRLPQQDTIPIGPATFAGNVCFSILFCQIIAVQFFAFQGWGANSNGIGSGPVNILQKVKFSTISNEACVEAVASVNRDGVLVDDQKFCTGPLTGGEIISISVF